VVLFVGERSGGAGRVDASFVPKTLRVATDVLPLLVNACSQECIQKLPKPADGYVAEPHQGGLELEQPQTRFG